jgi:hypothetical protein
MIWLHVSELSIDRLLAGELRDADADAMRDHARACKACGDRLADAESTQREFVQLASQIASRLPSARPLTPVARPTFAPPTFAPPIEPLLPTAAPIVPRRSSARSSFAARPRTIALVGAAVAAAAACALFVAWPAAGHDKDPRGLQVAMDGDRTNGARTNGALDGDRTNGARTNGGAVAGERTKGRAIAGFFVAHDGDVRRGGVRETVTPGDRLQLYTTTSVPSWFAVVSVDERGLRSVYVEPRVIEPGTERLLPLSLELDAALGTETLIAIFCAERIDPLAVDLSAAAAVTTASSEPAASSGSAAPHSEAEGCTLDRFTLEKVAR